MTHDTEYQTACREAATAQGLDPVIVALTAAGIPHAVEQTGGFCMVVYTYADPTAEASASVGVTLEDGYLIVEYDGTDGCEGEILAQGLTAEAAATRIGAWLRQR